MNKDSQFGNLSCQLGGLRLNGNITYGTALSSSVVTIDDPGVIKHPSVSGIVGYLPVMIGKTEYFLPLYQ